MAIAEEEVLLEVRNRLYQTSSNASSPPFPPAPIYIPQGNPRHVAEYPTFRISSVWLQRHLSFWFKGDVSRLRQIHHILTSKAYCQEEEKHLFKHVKLVCTEISAEELTFNFSYLYKLFFHHRFKESLLMDHTGRFCTNMSFRPSFCHMEITI